MKNQMPGSGKSSIDRFDPQQWFPTYRFDTTSGRDVALAEYQASSHHLQNEEKIFTSSASIAVLGLGALSSIVLGTDSQAIDRIIELSHGAPGLTFLFSLNLFFAATFILYFATRLKAISQAARKIVILRRMLGLSYGSQSMVLPIWQVEGANEPFSIKIFPGWGAYSSYPIYLISILSAFIFFQLYFLNSSAYACSLLALYFTFLLYIYRATLYDLHENSFLLTIKMASRILRVPLVKNFEFVIYHSKLAVYEIARLKIDISNVKETAVFLEDQTFFTHKGVAITGILRAIRNRYKYKRKTGGSTLTQQLVRTLFISKLENNLRRKFIEILLAFWIEVFFTKEDILLMHLTSVRYDSKIFGITQAANHFFGANKKKFSNVEAFFLIERISNISSSILSTKLLTNVKNAYNIKFLAQSDVLDLIDIYKKLLSSGVLKSISGMTFPDFEKEMRKIIASPY